MLEVQRILKMMNSEMLYKIFKISDLTELEYKILQEFILRETPRDAICDDLGISRSTFTNSKNIALTKVKIHLTNLLDEKIKQMAK
jgi:DNA-binding CsgD family transcriptional regulator